MGQNQSSVYDVYAESDLLSDLGHPCRARLSGLGGASTVMRPKKPSWEYPSGEARGRKLRGKYNPNTMTRPLSAGARQAVAAVRAGASRGVPAALLPAVQAKIAAIAAARRSPTSRQFPVVGRPGVSPFAITERQILRPLRPSGLELVHNAFVRGGGDPSSFRYLGQYAEIAAGAGTAVTSLLKETGPGSEASQEDIAQSAALKNQVGILAAEVQALQREYLAVRKQLRAAGGKPGRAPQLTNPALRITY